jgi:Ca2+-binding EF-hand superfamily protein
VVIAAGFTPLRSNSTSPQYQSKESSNMQLTKSLVPFGFTLLAGACGGAPEAADSTQKPLDLETATQVAALEVNEDGGSVEGADATEDEPLLLRRCGFSAVRKYLVERFDANEDGVVEGEEQSMLSEEFGGRPNAERHRPPLRPFINIGRQLRLSLLLKLYDSDASGELDETERALLEADLTARCEQRMETLLATFDADGSGELEDSEWDAAKAAIRERFAARRAEFVAEFDLDADGELNPEERLAARESRVEAHQTERAELFAEFDLDGNGELNPEEQEALREALRERLRGEHNEIL